jgi:mediator of RNA polymerase II transcription subunit 22
LVSELKQTALFSGFASINENVDRRIEAFEQGAEKMKKLLERIGEDAAARLKQLESHYYFVCRKEPQA